MGCDIHLTLERRLRKDRKHVISPKRTDVYGNVTAEEKSWTEEAGKWRRCYITGYDGTWGDRIYGMFARLADVRSEGEKNLIPLRGFPEDATDGTLERYGSLVVPDSEMESNKDNEWFCEHRISESDANDYVGKGYSTIIERDGKKYCTGPDWHSPNWCTTEEMEMCVKDLFIDKETGRWHGDYDEWTALVGAMKGYEMSGEWECRAVFWFDN